jgi:hypothetical protein
MAAATTKLVGLDFRLVRRGRIERTGAARLRGRGSVPQRAVRADDVVGLPPATDEHLRLQEGVKDFAVQQLVSQFASSKASWAVRSAA